MTSRRFMIGVVCCATLSGCYTRRQVTAPAPVNAELLVRYSSATPVRMIIPADTSRMVPVRELRGRGGSVSGDTIRMVVSRGRDAEWQPIPGGTIAFVTLGPGTLVETVRFDARKTIVRGVTIFGVAGAIAAFIYFVGPAFAD